MSKRSHLNLFENPADHDQLYMRIRADQAIWHRRAKYYWQSIYSRYQIYLEKNFTTKFPNEFLSGLWELTLIHFLGKQASKGILQLCSVGGTKEQSKPDFAFTINGQKFYLEATSATSGKVDFYPDLNQPLDLSMQEAQRIPVEEYRERLCAALRAKISDEENCKAGYKDFIEDDAGLIIAISLAPIPQQHHPLDPVVDLSCLFPNNHIPSFSFAEKEIFYSPEESFQKINNPDASIFSNYFGTPKYKNISAVLIGYSFTSFYPPLIPLSRFYSHRPKNDFLLIHNSFAIPTKKLPFGVLPVREEHVATEINMYQIVFNAWCNLIK